MFNKLFVSLLTAVILLTAVTFTATAATKKSNAVIQIKTLADLQNINNNLSGQYVLMNDITGSSSIPYPKITPIGGPGNPFTGSFDGNGHTISNLDINTSVRNNDLGFFGNIGSAGNVRNLKLKNINLIATDTNSVGGFAGNNGGTISNSSITDSDSISTVEVTSSTTANNNVGGFIGYNSGIINNCFSNLIVGASDIDGLGGFAGTNFHGTIEKSWALGEIDVNVTTNFSENIGGFIGGNSGKIIDSYSQNLIRSADNNYDIVGGFVGFNFDYSGGSVDSSYSTTSLTGLQPPTAGKAIGGFAGAAQGSIPNLNLTRCYWDTQTSGQSTSEGQGNGYVMGRTTAQMKLTDTSQPTYTGWDSNIWLFTQGQYPTIYNNYTSISGTALSNGPGSAPLANVTVEIAENGQDIAHATTDSSGNFTAQIAKPVLEANNTLVFYLRDSSVKSTLIYITGTSAPTITLYGNSINIQYGSGATAPITNASLQNAIGSLTADLLVTVKNGNVFFNGPLQFAVSKAGSASLVGEVNGYRGEAAARVIEVTGSLTGIQPRQYTINGFDFVIKP